MGEWDIVSEMPSESPDEWAVVSETPTEKPPGAAEKPGLLSRVGMDIGNAYTELTTPVEYEGGGLTETVPKIAEKVLRTAGHLGSAAGDVFIEGAKGAYNLLTSPMSRETIKDVGSFLADTDIVKAQKETLGGILGGYGEFEKANPRLAKDLAAGANSLNLLGVGPAAKLTRTAAREAMAVPKAIIGEVIPESLPGKLIASGAKWSTTLPPETRAALTDTMIQEKILLNPKGYAKLESTVDGLNEEIKSALKPIADQPLDAKKVASRAEEARTKAASTYDPETNLAKVDAEVDKFLGNWDGKLTVGKAQTIKQDIYKQLKKHYESVSKTGNALYADGEIAAMKNIARGLKEEIEMAAKDVSIKSLNARESQLLTLEPHLRRAVGRIENHNILSLDDVLAAGVGVALGGPVGVGFGIAKKALGSPSVKSRMAMGLENMRTKSPVIPKAIPPAPTAAEMATMRGVGNAVSSFERGMADRNMRGAIQADLESGQYGSLLEGAPPPPRPPRSLLEESLNAPDEMMATEGGAIDTGLRISAAEREAQHEFIQMFRATAAEQGASAPKNLSDVEILRIAKEQGIDFRLGKQPGEPTGFAPPPSTDVRSTVLSGDAYPSVKIMDDKTWQAILKEEGGNRNKARAKAIQLGYKFNDGSMTFREAQDLFKKHK